MLTVVDSSLKPLNGDVLTPLSKDEKQDRARLDAVLDANEDSALVYIRALKEYRDKKLYRADYPNFDAYLADRRKKYSRARASQLISHVEVSDTLALLGVETLPESERQTRELRALSDPLEQSTAWRAAQEASGQEQPGSEWVKGAVETIQQAKDTDGFVNSGDGRMRALDAAVIQSVAEAKQRQRDHILAGKKPALAVLEGVVNWRGEDGEARNMIALILKSLTDEQYDAISGGQIVKIYIYPVVTQSE